MPPTDVSPPTPTSTHGSGPQAWWRSGSARSVYAALVMCLLVLAVYVPIPSSPEDNSLIASDYFSLHARRIRFAQEAISTRGHLPAWYPRELMGTPFWSNVQSFPFIPTRLVLLGMDTLHLIIAAVWLAALLAALFTFLWARSVGLGRIGSAAAGWTFACAGFFASRVMAGHLPLLEAYPALPLLLWRVELCLGEKDAPRGARLAVRLGVLALATCCVMLAGHPQLPVYAVGVAGLYVMYRGWRRRPQMLRAAAAMALGAACAAFALWPMLLLIRRSTRVLALDPAANDLAMPYRRLLAMLFPWRDGWPTSSPWGPSHPFSGYAVGGDNLFWDTICYVGWVPLIAVVFLAVRKLVRHRSETDDPLAATATTFPTAPWVFVAFVGIAALLLALPLAQQISRMLPGTILRSPARLMYVTTFALAAATGFAADLLVARARCVQVSSHSRWIAGALAGVLLLAHAIDLGVHDRAFVKMVDVPTEGSRAFESKLRDLVGDGRVAIDFNMALPYNRDLDDVGFFDSIMLARPYAAVQDLNDSPPGLNVQIGRGSELSARALAATGTRFVLTGRTDRYDLKIVRGPTRFRMYGIPEAQPRAAFHPLPDVLKVDRDETHRRLRDPSHDMANHVMLPPDASLPASPPIAQPATSQPATAPATTGPSSGGDSVTYTRPSSDRIAVRVRSNEAGVLRVLESWDTGWRVTVDGAPAAVLCADDAFLAIALPTGDHNVEFAYFTPGAATGVAISLASLCALGVLCISATRGRDDSAVPNQGR